MTAKRAILKNGAAVLLVPNPKTVAAIAQDDKAPQVNEQHAVHPHDVCEA